jgi:hypothetical protein
MSAEVKEILTRIERLTEADQLELRAELLRKEEQEWKALSAAARKQAAEKGLDDAAIARVVESLRYGEKPTVR